MTSLTTADALRLAINVLRDAAESRKLPSGAELNEATAGLHADAADTLEASLVDLEGHE
ncbi:hypothetical protein [Cupriavidus sp. D39]|uniref:hypothetical protein n=1 Tax=Cupriavidus sp. D39 TaxID=2997877 RepID=UPI002270824D|nr:hypothetical protein [Cupriavidus sp. D39]MCY0852532.1 hypothetical protein [Cupriavidus sp. D39]